jgi:polysaccharide export outer membrane protein
MFRTSVATAFALAATLAGVSSASAQTAAATVTSAPTARPAAATTSVPPSTGETATVKPVAAPPTVTGGIKPPADYVIGVDDVLDVVFWQDKDMSASVTVRPDGNISLPLLNELKAAGLTPEELRSSVREAATKFVEEPSVSVVVKTINSRKVFITGQVAKPGPYALTDTTSVLQMIATAGGPSEYAKTDKITIVRRENGKDVVHKFNYKDVSQGKSMAQNIELKPGDTIIIP